MLQIWIFFWCACLHWAPQLQHYIQHLRFAFYAYDKIPYLVSSLKFFHLATFSTLLWITSSLHNHVIACSPPPQIIYFKGKFEKRNKQWFPLHIRSLHATASIAANTILCNTFLHKYIPIYILYMATTMPLPTSQVGFKLQQCYMVSQPKQTTSSSTGVSSTCSTT